MAAQMNKRQADSSVFRIVRRMPDGEYKVIGSYMYESMAREMLARVQKMQPDRQYAIVFPESFLNTTASN